MTQFFIEKFYLFFQGMLLFQAFFLGILYFITNKKDIFFYSIFLLLSAAYFFLNAPNTFFGLNDNAIFNADIYRYANIPLIIIINLFYILFLRAFFAGLYNNKLVAKLFKSIFLSIPFLVLIFFVLRYLQIDTQSVFYVVNLLAAGISIVIIIGVLKYRVPNTGWVAFGMLFNILGTSLTILMIVLERYKIRNLFTVEYPLFFMRCGILADMFFYQVALLKKWHYQEKELAVEKLQSQLEVEKLRNKISGELHDDIGSTLSGIAMYSHMTDSQLQSGDYDKAKHSVGVIQKSANEIVGKLSDLVWTINPSQDSFTRMLEKIEAYGEEMCSAKKIHFQSAYQNLNLIKEPGMDVRQHLYFFAKEAINNAVKYSAATAINFEAFFEKGVFKIIVADNGNGFDVATVAKGNGLGNMEQRAAAIGAAYSFQSKAGNGTNVCLQLKIPQ